MKNICKDCENRKTCKAKKRMYVCMFYRGSEKNEGRVIRSR